MNQVYSPVGRNEFDDKAQGRERNFYLHQIDLSIARDTVEIKHAGNLIYCDRDTSGLAYVRFSANDNPLFPLSANSLVKNFPYKTLFITNTAQAGKVLNLWYGQDVGIQPPNQDIQTIGRVEAVTVIDGVTIVDKVALVDEVTPRSLVSHWGSSVSTSVLTLVTPAANTNGVRIDNVNTSNLNVSGHMTLQSKSSAPVIHNDTAASCLFHFMVSSTNPYVDKPAYPLIVPAGLGLYALATAAVGEMSVDYEVLP